MNWKKKYFNAIVIVYLSENSVAARKYRNISKFKLAAFETFARSIVGAHHINYYEKVNGEFSHRVYLQN